MRLESKKYLYDIARAADLIRRFTKGKAFADFEGDEMMRSAAERQFEIIGKALRAGRVELFASVHAAAYSRQGLFVLSVAVMMTLPGCDIGRLKEEP